MFGFFKKRAEKARQEGIDQFDSTIEKLKHADQAVGFAVGHGVNMASAFFFKKFGGVSDFNALSKNDKVKYVQSLAKTGSEVGKNDPLMGLGFDLFKMWVVAIMQEDLELAEYFSEHLGVISKTSDLT